MSYEATLTELMEKHQNLFVLTAENRGQVIFIEDKFPKRFLDTGINEQSLIGIAAGLAKLGNVPIVHALACFLTMRAYEFIRTDIGLMNLPIKLIGTSPGLLSEANGPTHQAVEDISLMRSIPNMNIFCPSDEQDMLLGLPKILTSPEPWYIRHNNIFNEHNHEDFTIGKAEIIGSGAELAIVTHGFMFGEAKKLYNMFCNSGIQSRLINMRCLKPYDKEVIIKCAQECKEIVVIEDHLLVGGLYSIVAETLLNINTSCKVTPFCLNTYFKPSRLPDILEYEGRSARKMWDFMRQNLST